MPCLEFSGVEKLAYFHIGKELLASIVYTDHNAVESSTRGHRIINAMSGIVFLHHVWRKKETILYPAINYSTSAIKPSTEEAFLDYGKSQIFCLIL